MSRRSKGPRLWLQPARRNKDGAVTEPAVWCVRDGSVKRSTGAGAGDIAAAEAFLREYLIKKGAPRVRDRDPSQVLIADAIAVYAQDKVGDHAREKDTRDRLTRVLQHFDGHTLDYLNMATCAAYVKARGKQAAARRELEDLRAAVRHHWKLGLVTHPVPVVLPDKGDARNRWLTRKEAAHLIRVARRRGRKSRHIIHFILVGLYTGTRASAICGAALAPTEGRGWIDLERGVFYRKAIGKKKTNKRQPSVRIPPQLLAHMRRWHRLNWSRESLIEWHGEPVLRVSKGFTALARAAGFADVSPHILRHTAITWQAQEGVPPHEICGFFGITMPMFESVYGHHHPDFQSNAVNALQRRNRQLPDRMNVTKREHAASNVVKISGF